ncbi:MAG: guanylate kinase [Sedimentisphaerales bacterium]|nr:guanylate kinase [Sedimentisphaerales bacterium]
MSHSENNKGKLVVISGPSGVGKSTITREVVGRMGAFLSVSATTRPKSDKEENGKEYWFLSREEFEKQLREEAFLEYAEVFGNYYGTPRGQVDKALAEGKTVLLEIDVQGGRQIRRMYPEALMIFILPPSQGDLAGRMRTRDRGEDETTTRRRLEEASRETAEAMKYYNNMVINDDLEQAIREVIDIIQSNDGE